MAPVEPTNVVAPALALAFALFAVAATLKVSLFTPVSVTSPRFSRFQHAGRAPVLLRGGIAPQPPHRARALSRGHCDLGQRVGAGAGGRRTRDRVRAQNASLLTG